MSIQPVAQSSIAALQPQATSPVSGQTNDYAAALAVTRQVPAQSVAQPSATQPQQPSVAEVQEAVKKTQEFLQSKANNLVFSLDKDSGEMVVKVVDSHTDEVIRQIPSKEMLELAHSLDEFQNTHGVLLKSKA